MNNFSNYEEQFLNLIKNQNFRNVILNIRENVKTIWSSDVRIIQNYTDHGFEHCLRIFEKLAKLIIKEDKTILMEEEIFLLMLGVYLHDIGMQCDIKKNLAIKELAENDYNANFKITYKPSNANNYLPAEQDEIRRNHNLLSAAWIKYAYKNSDNVLNMIKKVDQMYIEDLIEICRYHSKLDIMNCDEETNLNDVRRKLVASILRFGDELDIDNRRVDIDTAKIFGFSMENEIFWYLHNNTRIKIEGSEIIITITLCEEDYNKYSSIVNELLIENFKNKNKILTDILTKYGIPVFVSEKSKVIMNDFTIKISEIGCEYLDDIIKKKEKQK